MRGWREPKLLLILGITFLGGGIYVLVDFGPAGIGLAIAWGIVGGIMLLVGSYLTFRNNRLTKTRERELGVKITIEETMDKDGVKVTSEEAMDKDKANNAIKGAWIVGIIAGVGTLVFSLIPGAMPFGPLILIDVFLLFGLSFGVYKKYRASAVILFIYFVVSLIFKLVEIGWVAFPIGIVLGIYIFQGIQGTFTYHKIGKAERISKANSEMDAGGTGTAN